jgi:hypothetical protein
MAYELPTELADSNADDFGDGITDAMGVEGGDG